VRHSLLLVLLFVLGTSGCASTAEPPPAPDQPVNATVVWDNSGHGGAAGRVPGYVHALAREVAFRPGSDAPVRVATAGNHPPSTPPHRAPPAQISSVLRDPIAAALAAAMQRPAPEVTLLPAQGRTQSQGPAPVANGDAELQDAWKKYCLGGNDMSEREWRAVLAAGGPRNVPLDLAVGCVHPK